MTSRKLWLLFPVSAAFFMLCAIALGAEPDMTPVTNDEFLKYLSASVGGLKGASALAIAATVVQAIVLFLKTPTANNVFLRIGGAWKLTIVCFLTVVAGVLGLMTAGVPLLTALIHSTTLSALLVFFNQIYRHVTERVPAQLPPDAPKIPLSQTSTVKAQLDPRRVVV